MESIKAIQFPHLQQNTLAVSCFTSKKSKIGRIMVQMGNFIHWAEELYMSIKCPSVTMYAGNWLLNRVHHNSTSAQGTRTTFLLIIVWHISISAKGICITILNAPQSIRLNRSTEHFKQGNQRIQKMEL